MENKQSPEKPAYTGKPDPMMRRAQSGAMKMSGIRGKYGTAITHRDASTFSEILFRAISARGTRKYYLGKLIMQAVRKRNRAKNAAFSAVTDYIGMQGGGGAADDLRFGLFRMRFNGCEIIAVYNLMKYLGHFRDIREIAAEFEENGQVLFGGFGTRPDAIADYLAAALPENISGDSVTSYEVRLHPGEESESYDELLRKAGAGILTFWNGQKEWTIHTVMLHRLSDGRIRIYNQYTNLVATERESIAAFLENGGKPYVPISLITAEETIR